MRKVAFLYPGQGSQKVGMGKSFLENYSLARNIFQEANEILGFNLEKICLEGPEEELVKTSNLQPALLTVSWIATCFLKEKGVFPQAVAGHSLGEYSAILAAGVVDFKTALRIVKERARVMHEETRKNEGGMAAVIGFDKENIVKMCKEIGEVEAVNFNCPGQIVISGKKQKISILAEELKKRGAKKVIVLPVSGAFHSYLMRSAARKFANFLDQFNFYNPTCKVVANVSGEYALSGEEIKKNLKLQMDHPVLWEKGMKLLIKDGFDTFIEVGPGKVLQGLIKRIDKKVKTMGVEDIRSANLVVQSVS